MKEVFLENVIKIRVDEDISSNQTDQAQFTTPLAPQNAGKICPEAVAP